MAKFRIVEKYSTSLGIYYEVQRKWLGGWLTEDVSTDLESIKCAKEHLESGTTVIEE